MNATGVTPLNSGTRFNNYKITAAIDQDESSIYYAATAAEDELPSVAPLAPATNAQQFDVREFAPPAMVSRASDGSGIETRVANDADAFAAAKQAFIRLARVLSEIADHGAGDSCRYVQENGTAYLITRRDQHESLAAYLKHQQKPIAADLLSAMMLRLLKALRTFHDAALFHNNLSPASVFLNADGVPSLGRFAVPGISALDDQTAADTGITPYTAAELNHRGAEPTVQSDLYALGATLYHCVAGVAPAPAAERLTQIAAGEDDPMLSAMELGQGRYSKHHLQCIDWMLSPLAQERPDSADSVLQVVSGFGRLKPRGRSRRDKKLTGDSRVDSVGRKKAWVWSAAAAVLIVIAVIAGMAALLPSLRTPPGANVAQAPNESGAADTNAVNSATVIDEPPEDDSPSVIQPVDDAESAAIDGFTNSSDIDRIAAYREMEKQQQFMNKVNRRADQLVAERMAALEAERSREAAVKQARVAAYVESANQALAADALLAHDTGALALYRKALREDPQSADAFAGTVAVAAGLVERGEKALAEKDVAGADKWAAVAASVFADSPGLATLNANIANEIKTQRATADEALQLAESALKKERKAAADHERRVATTLARVESAIERGEILAPADASAVVELKRAMNLIQGSQRVVQGTNDAVGAFARQASQAIIDNDLAAAAVFISQAEQINPNHPTIEALRQHVADRERLTRQFAEREAVLQQQADASRIRAEQAEEASRTDQALVARASTPSIPESSRVQAPVTETAEFVDRATATAATSAPPATAASTQLNVDQLREAVANYYAGRYDNAFELLPPLAELGSARAQFRLAVMYFMGRGAPLDPVSGGQWLSRASEGVRAAAERGEAWAEADLGQMYEEGWGVPQKYEEAVRWYRRAATKGYGGAQNNLGVLYEQGLGVPRDRRQAVAWLRRAAGQGDSIARENLSTLGVRP